MRRWFLKRFRKGYVARMAETRQGDVEGAPHEILDSRDLKFCRNQCTAHWAPEDDRFRWREKIPFASWGRAELLIMGLALLIATILTGWLSWTLVAPWLAYSLTPIPFICLCIIVYFFRDPPRTIPQQPGLMLAPADGKVVEITPIEHDEYIGGPAVQIALFLSVFNVHINRTPCKARVISLVYTPGEFVTALDPECALRNENTWIGMEEEDAPHRPFILRQVSGVLARRIVCDLRPGEVVQRGAKIGMIKLGSRTELILPATDDVEIAVEVGQKVRAGVSILATFKNEPTE